MKTNKGNIEIIAFFAIAFVAISFLIYLISQKPKWDDEITKQKLQKVEDCKAKTSDVDWCYKTFFN